MSTDTPLVEPYLSSVCGREFCTADQLAQSCQLETYVCELVYELQCERDISNVYLSTAGKRCGMERYEQHRRTDLAERHFHQYLRHTRAGKKRRSDSARLYHCISRSLLQLETLTELRRRIGAESLDMKAATEVWSGLIDGLLAVVFEAVDCNTDSEISLDLQALFHSLQAKEGNCRLSEVAAKVMNAVELGERQGLLNK